MSSGINTIARVMLVVALPCGTGCARPDWIEQTVVTIDVTGTWRSTTGGLFELNLEQQGTRVKGSMFTGTVTGAIEGTVAGDVFRFRQMDGTYATWEGEMTVNGDEMRGNAKNVQIGRRLGLHLERVTSSARPSSRQP